MTTGWNRNTPVWLWRKFAKATAINSYEKALAEAAHERLAIITRPDRKGVLLELPCQSRAEVQNLRTKFGGSLEQLPRDWQRRVFRAQKSKPPLKVGRRRLIIPAGAAFGTGEHPTTAMSLRLLERLTRYWKDDWSAFDLGTGSGILALAAHSLGAKKVIGIDIDPIAISTAKQNARTNRIDKVQFQVADVRKWNFARSIDVVTANLFSELLIEIIPRLSRGRRLILSGILREQERGVVRALKRNRMEIAEIRRRGKWIAILAGRKTDLRA